MKKALRFLVLSAAFTILCVPVFADGGPGSGDPLPPSSSSSAGTNATATVIAILLSYLGM